MNYFKVCLCTFIFVFLFCLVGCSSVLEKEGEIYFKEYREEYVETRKELDKYKNSVEYDYFYEDLYILYVKYKKDNTGSYETKAFYVTEDVYNSFNIGDKYLYNSTKDLLSPIPIEKEKVKQ